MERGASGQGPDVPVHEESLRDLSRLSGVVLGQEDLPSTLAEVTRIASRIAGADGASITSLVEGVPTVVATSGPWAQQLDELQYEEREGPCLDATRTGNVFRVRDLTGDTRWPFYSVRAGALGARSMASLPMASEGKVLGALNLYGREVDAFSAEDVVIGQLVAAQAGMAMQVAATFFHHRDLADQMRQALTSRAVIEQAKGVLMARGRCGEQEAFDALVALSQSTNRKLRDVAREVVTEASSAAP